MKSQLRLIAWAAAGILVVVTGWLPARAQDESAEPPPPALGKTAIVDIAVVSREYQALQQKDAELRDLKARRIAYLESLTAFAFLSETNFNEVLEILGTPPASEEKSARLAELADLSEQNLRRLRELEVKDPRTAQETEHFNMLRELSRDRREQLQQLEADMAREYDEHVAMAQRELMQNVEAAVGEYAQQNGYTLVLDGSVVIYGGEDITRAIIAKLNPPAEEAGEATEPEQ